MRFCFVREQHMKYISSYHVGPSSLLLEGGEDEELTA